MAMTDGSGGWNRETLDSELSLSGLAWFVVGLGILMLVSGALMWALSSNLIGRLDAADPPPPVLPAARQPWTPPEPRLQIDPEGELEAMRSMEDERLDSYGWVDETEGVVRIPIDEAMRLVAADSAEGSP